jgi:hypothetical protein
MPAAAGWTACRRGCSSASGSRRLWSAPRAEDCYAIAHELETDEGSRTIEGATREDAPRLVAEAVAAGRQVFGVRVLTSTLEETYLEAVGDEVS